MRDKIKVQLVSQIVQQHPLPLPQAQHLDGYIEKIKILSTLLHFDSNEFRLTR